MDGIYLIDKAPTWTSRDVVNRLQRRFKFKKIGHSGTLDPFASGLLIVLIGNATKIVPYLNELSKTYIATLKLGETTPSLDPDSAVSQKANVPKLTKSAVETVLESFIGVQKQIPPMTSAIKVDGVPLYKRAHQGIEISRQPRNINIYSLRLINYDEVKQTIIFEARVSSGTYIRVLGQDIAFALGTLGYLTALRRTEIGDFSVSEAKDVEAVNPEDKVAIIRGLKHLTMIEVSEDLAAKIKNGQKLSFETEALEFIAISPNQEVIAHLKYDQKIKKYRIVRGLF